MTNQYLPEGGTYSADLVNEVLAGLPDEMAQGIAQQILAHAAETKEGQTFQNVQLHTANLAILAHQYYQPDLPDDFYFGDIDHALRDESAEVLRGFGLLSAEQKATIPASVLDFAACYYVQREAAYGASDDDIQEVIAPAGLTIEDMHERLATLLLESGRFPRYESTEQIRHDARTLLAMARHICPKTTGKLAEQMRTDLTAQGYTLPELNENNAYGYNDEEEEYILPEPTPAMLPPRHSPAATH